MANQQDIIYKFLAQTVSQTEFKSLPQSFQSKIANRAFEVSGGDENLTLILASYYGQLLAPDAKEEDFEEDGIENEMEMFLHGVDFTIEGLSTVVGALFLSNGKEPHNL